MRILHKLYLILQNLMIIENIGKIETTERNHNILFPLFHMKRPIYLENAQISKQFQKRKHKTMIFTPFKTLPIKTETEHNRLPKYTI